MMRFEQELIDFFSKQDSVSLAYLFGSTARGEVHRLNDIDIAVMLDKRFSKKDALGLELNLISELTGILKTNNVDLVVMNNAPLLLNYNIIRNGRILKSDESKRMDFENRILSRYLDEQYCIKRHTDEILQRIAGKA